jgi:hypothetical protein
MSQRHDFRGFGRIVLRPVLWGEVKQAITHRDGRLSFDSCPSCDEPACAYISALAYELISQFRLISSNCGVVHCIVFLRTLLTG